MEVGFYGVYGASVEGFRGYVGCSGLRLEGLGDIIWKIKGLQLHVPQLPKNLKPCDSRMVWSPSGTKSSL